MDSLGPFINRKVVVLHRYDTVYQAARALNENNIGCVIVADIDGYAVGIVTDRDLICGGTSAPISQNSPLDGVMERGLIWATEKDSVKDVIDLMVENSIRRIPIVKHTVRGHIKCVGFVSLDDLICQGAINIDQAAQVIRPQLNPKTRRLPKQMKHAQTRLDQTEAEFCKRVAQETGLNEDDAREAVFCFLETLFRRVSPGAANDLASQLPLRWKEYLSAFMTGPNRRVDVSELIKNIAPVINVSEEKAKHLATLIYRALSYLTAGHTMDHLSRQLPQEFQDLFENSVGGIENLPRLGRQKMSLQKNI